MIRVLLADDQALIRAGFAALVGSARRPARWSARPSTARTPCASAATLRPDVVLMDIRMPDARRPAAPPSRSPRDPELDGVRVLVLTTFEADDYVLAALRAGASGFLGKDVEPQPSSSTAIRVVAAGESLLSPRATRALIARLPRPAADGAADATSATARWRCSPSASGRSWRSSGAA